MGILDNDGDVTHVQGSGKSPYTLKNVGGTLSCDCPAWRNVGGPIDKRTCKHLKKVRGAAAEDARIGQVGTNTARTSAAAPNVSLAPRTSPDCACERGSTCDVSHDPATCPCAQCVTAEAGGKKITADAEYAQTVLDRAASEGRKLRQDEKAKLHGPPVLLAHSFEDSDVDPTGWWMSEKLDGVRAYWDGENFISRQGNIFHAPDWFKSALPNIPLDGELWIARQSFQKTISVVKRLDWGDGAKLVKYVVFDAPSHEGIFESRLNAVVNHVIAANVPHVKAHPHMVVQSKQHLKDELDQLVALGAEGLMIRKPKSIYEAGRSHSLLKVKPFKDAEAVVIAHEPGKGRHKGRLGGLLVRMPNGKTFNVGTGLTDDDRRNPPKIGSVVTYRFTELTDGGTGVPKCASFVSVRDYE